MKLPEINYDLSLPFSLALAKGGGELQCQKKIRVIPGRRLVCKGRWQQQDVYVKVFVDPVNARRDFNRESKGIAALTERKIKAPEVLFVGQLSGDNAFVIVYKSIQPSTNMNDAWQTATVNEKNILFKKLVTVVAEHHDKGVSQQDMHLRNFLVAGDDVYTLDAADIHIEKHSLVQRQSLINLVSLFALIHPMYDPMLRDAFSVYAGLRNWKITEKQLDGFMNDVDWLRRSKKEKYLKKIYRESSAFINRRSSKQFLVYDRLFDSKDLRNLINDPDSYIESGKVIKRGNTCTIARVNINGRSLIIKRYNQKGLWHAIRRAVRRTRASVSWTNSHRLQIDHINTALPVALLEKRAGPFGILRMQSYFVMCEVKGTPCLDYFLDKKIDDEDKQLMAVSIANLFKLLASHKISHGDMKITNFIISNNHPVILDLDAMHEHQYAWFFNRAFAKDVRRFFRNWAEMPELSRLFEEAFTKAGISIDTHPGAKA